MRDGDLRAKVTATPVVYEDPYSGQEFLLLSTDSGEVVGVTYDPRASSAPVAWRSTCQHCRGGRSHHLSIHSKREIQLLCSRVVVCGGTHYVAPTNSAPLDLVASEVRNLRTIVVTSSSGGVVPDHVLTAKARPPYRSVEYEGDRRKFQSPILLRAIKFLLSAREPTPREVYACLSPLVGRPTPRGRSNPCNKIAWAKVLKETGE